MLTYDADAAWHDYLRTGMIRPGFESEIAARRRLCREWADAGAPLR